MSAPAAPEVRIDQLSGLRAILAAGRSDRPVEFSAAPRRPGAAESCPFCEGREQRTPPELWADRPGGGEPDTPGWRVRAVPNLYPAVGAPPGEADAARSDAGDSGSTGSADDAAGALRDPFAPRLAPASPTSSPRRRPAEPTR